MSLTTAEISQFFSPDWFGPGLVDDLLIAHLRDNFSEADDRSPEHYRWRAFTLVLKQRRPAAEPLLRQLLRLAEIDTDPSLRDSMAITLLSTPECPASLASGTGFDDPRIQSLVRARVERESLSRPIPEGDWLLVTADICRDGGSFEATVRCSAKQVSLLLTVLSQPSPDGGRHGGLFATNGSDPTPMTFLSTREEERGWARALSSASGGTTESAERAREMAAILSNRAG